MPLKAQATDAIVLLRALRANIYHMGMDAESEVVKDHILRAYNQICLALDNLEAIE